MRLDRFVAERLCEYLRMVSGGGELALCVGCKSDRLFVCRINRYGQRIVMCEQCWERIELALDPMYDSSKL
jgi:hypothetical protein